MYGVLKAKAEEMGFKNPEAIARVGAAQSALETGYGKALAGGNNYFGIKGSGGNKQSTKEYSPERGYYTSNESFRTYNGMEDSAADYLRLMQNPRYAKVAAAQTPEEAIAHQSRSGYATSPQYGSSLRAIHSANMAEGGIARLNKGGVPRFQAGALISGEAGDFTRVGTGNATEADWEAHRRELARLDAIVSQNRQNTLNNALKDIPDPATLYPELPRMDTRRFLGMPRVPLTERSKYLQHAATFGETGSGGAGIGADTYYPPSTAGSDAARFRDQASGVVDAASPSATPSVLSRQGMSPEYQPSVLSGIGMSPEYEPSTNVPPSNTGNTGSSGNNSGGGSSSGAGDGSSSGTGSGSRGGERQKSEYDLIREDIMNQREELKRQKQEDKYMAILQAGLGMMGGTSPNAFANIGQGASMGIAQYGQSGKQRAAENAALNKGLITAQRYRSMDEYQRAALADRAAGRADIIADRAEGRADTLNDKGEARTLREKQHNQQAEGQIDLNIANRQKAIESMVQAKLSKLDPLGSLSGDQQMQKFNQMVQEELAKDIKEGTLKNLYERKKYYQKQNWGIDFEMPNYGAASTSAPSGVTVRKVK